MSNPLKSKNFKKIITIAAVAAITYGVGSAVMAASAAGTAGAGAGAASMAGGMDAAVNAGISANAVGGGAAVAAKTVVPEVAKQVATDGLVKAGSQAASKGFLSSMMENPMVQYGLVQTGGAMLQGAMQPDAEQSTNSGYARRDFSQANPYQQQSQAMGVAPNNTMPVYNQETKRWES